MTGFAARFSTHIRGIDMGKKLISLAVICALCLALFGCAKKQADLSQQDEGYIRDLTTNGVYHEVYIKYGLEPGVTTDEIKAYGERTSTGRLTFETKGSYSVRTESGDIYTGTFKVTGHIEAHGMGTDSCEITAPKHGLKELPEQSGAQQSETQQSGTPQNEWPDQNIYEPFARYIDENIKVSPALMGPVYECDLNGDGSPELCASVEFGSGVISTLVAVYDVWNDCGHLLNEREEYDYIIEGVSDGKLIVCRRKYQSEQKTYGTLVLQDDKLVFVADET